MAGREVDEAVRDVDGREVDLSTPLPDGLLWMPTTAALVAPAVSAGAAPKAEISPWALVLHNPLPSGVATRSVVVDRVEPVLRVKTGASPRPNSWFLLLISHTR